MNTENINKNIGLKKFSNPDSQIDVLFERLISRDLSCLPQLLTLVENKTTRDNSKLNNALASLPINEKSLRIAISGPPGVGKSSLIDLFGMNLIQNDLKIAVLAIDPSSEITQGSILGDKTRMPNLSKSVNAFIRPSPNNLENGGIRNSTYDSIRICEVAGFDIIIIETVGVGQSEIAAAQITDLFFLMIPPGAGDELQGIKKGIVEMADFIIVNKADGDTENLASKTASDYKNALHYASISDKLSAKVEILTASTLNGSGIDFLTAKILEFRKEKTFQDKKLIKRHTQESKRFVNQTNELILNKVTQKIEFQEKFQLLRNSIINSNKNIYTAMNEISTFLTQYFNI